MTKINVSPAKATELMAQGYKIECYVILPPAEVMPIADRKIKKYYQKTDMFVISVEHHGPIKGKMVPVWDTAYRVLWGKDVTKPYSKAEIVNCLKVSGNTDPSMFSYLVGKLKVLRHVESQGSLL